MNERVKTVVDSINISNNNIDNYIEGLNDKFSVEEL